LAPQGAEAVPGKKMQTAMKTLRTRVLLSALVAVNTAVVGGALGLYREQQRAKVPVAALSADVKTLQGNDADTRAKLEETRTKIDETRAKLDETRAKLDQTRAKMDDHARAITATAQRQKDLERESHDQQARTARQITALTSRIGRVEKDTYKLDDALKLIDLVQGRTSEEAPHHDAPAKKH